MARRTLAAVPCAARTPGGQPARIPPSGRDADTSFTGPAPMESGLWQEGRPVARGAALQTAGRGEGHRYAGARSSASPGFMSRPSWPCRWPSSQATTRLGAPRL
eukprot:6679571-Alexandrium_andersonii.AAC.1